MAKHVTVVFVLCFCVRLLVICTLPEIHVSSDSLEYLELTQSLDEDASFSLNDVPNTLRTPGYPVFLWMLHLPSNDSLGWIAVCQAFLSSIESVLLFLLGCKIAGIRYAYGASLVFVLNPGSWLSVSSVLTEPLFSLLLILSIFALSKVQPRRSLGLSFLAGSGVGCLTLVRPIAQWLFIPLIFFVWAKGDKQRSLKLATLFLMGLVCTQGAWMARNAYHYGSFYVSEISSAALYVYWGQAVKASHQGIAPEPLFDVAWGEWDQMATQATPPEMKKQFGQEAFHLIKRHVSQLPIVFIKGAVRQVVDSPSMKLFQSYNPQSRVSVGELKSRLIHPESVFDWIEAGLVVAVRVIELVGVSLIFLFAFAAAPLHYAFTRHDESDSQREIVTIIFSATMVVLLLCLFSSGPYSNFRFREQYFSLVILLASYSLKHWVSTMKRRRL